MYERKTRDRYDVMTNYGYGWEAEYSSYDRKDARDRLKEYQENALGRYTTKFEKHRERNDK